MDFNWAEWTGVLLRFAHVLAAIMWIGNSLLFTWMELRLIPRPDDQDRDDPDLLGHLDMLHGGGVFHLEKRLIRPDAIPSPLYWFKWQSYTTWLTGFLLLCVLFYRDGATLADATRTSLSGPASAGLSLAGLVGGWVFYDLVWRSPLGKNTVAAGALSFLGLAAATWLYGQVFNGRALYLQIGAMMATCMTANVFVHIMGNQHRFMRALQAGQSHDPAFGKRAKSRSLHNHHITFPVLFLMLSAHFPRLHAAHWNVPILLVIVPGLVAVKWLMNSRLWFRPWLASIFGVVLLVAVVVGLLLQLPAAGKSAVPADPLVDEGRRLFEANACATCHMQGTSQLGPSLVGIYGHPQELADGRRVVVDDAYLRRSILEPQADVVAGFAPAMPPFAGRFDEPQLDALVAYLRSLTFTSPADTPAGPAVPAH